MILATVNRFASSAEPSAVVVAAPEAVVSPALAPLQPVVTNDATEAAAAVLLGTDGEGSERTLATQVPSVSETVVELYKIDQPGAEPRLAGSAKVVLDEEGTPHLAAATGEPFDVIKLGEILVPVQNAEQTLKSIDVVVPESGTTKGKARIVHVPPEKTKQLLANLNTRDRYRAAGELIARVEPAAKATAKAGASVAAKRSPAAVSASVRSLQQREQIRVDGDPKGETFARLLERSSSKSACVVLGEKAGAKAGTSSIRGDRDAAVIRERDAGGKRK
jgi:hypothetical protein